MPMASVIAVVRIRWGEKVTLPGERFWGPEDVTARLIAIGAAEEDPNPPAEAPPEEVDVTVLSELDALKAAVAALTAVERQKLVPTASGLVTPSNTAPLPDGVRGLWPVTGGHLIARLKDSDGTPEDFGVVTAGQLVLGEFTHVLVDDGAGNATSGTWRWLR